MTDVKTVACQGGHGTQGHPKIYLAYTEEGWVICPYCSHRFTKEVQ